MIGLALSVVLCAAPEPAELIDTARRQLEQHHEVDARKTLERAKGVAADQPQLLAQVYLLLGLAFAEDAEEKRAIESFQTALKLDRTVQLPNDTAPKVVEWWVRAGGAAPPAPEPVKPEPPKSEPPKTEPPPPASTPAPEPVSAPAPAVTASPVAPEPHHTYYWLLPAVATVAAGVTGALLLSGSDSRYQQLSTAPVLALSDARNTASTGQTLQTGAFIAFGVAVAALLATLGVWWGVDR